MVVSVFTSSPLDSTGFNQKNNGNICEDSRYRLARAPTKYKHKALQLLYVHSFCSVDSEVLCNAICYRLHLLHCMNLSAMDSKKQQFYDEISSSHPFMNSVFIKKHLRARTHTRARALSLSLPLFDGDIPTLFSF